MSWPARHRGSPKFEDRLPDPEAPCGVVVQGLPLTGVDGLRYVRTREGRFLPVTDPATDKLVLSKASGRAGPGEL